MTPRQCRYQCGCLLDAWDDDAKKYREAGSGGLHTKERCQEAKAKLSTGMDERWLTEKGKEQLRQMEQKDDHGNESYSPKVSGEVLTQGKETTELKGMYIDHTQGQKLKLKILTSTEAEGLSLLYNTFGESHTIRFSQYQIADSLYTIAVFFEEVPLKQ